MKKPSLNKLNKN